MKNHTVEIRVRYQETDKMGIVYYANYFVWFEIARTEFFRSLGLHYKRLEDEKKIYLPVVEASCRYRAPLRYDDKVFVTAGLSSVGRARIKFEYKVECSSKLVASGVTEHTFISSELTPVAIPDEIRETLTGVILSRDSLR
jgi:acyl-CoA thioester hydrolase